MKIKNIVTVLLVAFILASCAPAAKVVPTKTAISTSTFTPVPTSTATPTPIPTVNVEGQIIPDPHFSNPEFFNLDNADSPIVQFANAFAIKPADVKLQNPQLFTSKDGQQFIVLATSDIPDSKDIDQTGIPLFVAEKSDNNEWVWSSTSIKQMCYFNGLKCGTTIALEGNPRYDELLINEFSIINSGGTSPQSVATEGLRYEKKYSLFAQENGISFRPAHLFDWGEQNPPNLNTATKAQITEWMNKWVYDVVNGYPYFDSINFANEPVGIYDGSQYWVTENNPWYRAYGKQWPVEAYSMIYNQLESKGLKPGEDVRLILNLPYGAKEWGYYPQFTVDFMTQMKEQIQAKVGPNAIMDVGIQFHLRDVPINLVDWGGPDIKDLDEETLTHFFQDLGKIGPVHITELSVKNIKNPNKVIDSVNLVFSAAIKSGAVEDIVFWEDIEKSNNLFNAELQNNPNYYLLLRILFSNLEK
jgi:hypothetical protein